MLSSFPSVQFTKYVFVNLVYRNDLEYGILFIRKIRVPINFAYQGIQIKVRYVFINSLYGICISFCILFRDEKMNNFSCT